nr:DNA topoisomerase [Candidatus Sigynarchaeota archaeon]
IHDLARGWAEIYPAPDIPAPTHSTGLIEGQTLFVESVNVQERQTRPPPPFSDITLLGYMEHERIGTKGTRASIIDKLKTRGYITRIPLKITQLGKMVVRLFETHLPDLISVNMTRQLEEELERIEHGEHIKQEIIEKARNEITRVYSAMQELEDAISTEFSGIASTGGDRERVVLGTCPSCKKGNFEIVTRPGGRRFIACTGVPGKTCSITLPIAQRGKIRPAGEICKTCGYPMVILYQRGRKPWRFCVNWTRCPSTRNGQSSIKA